MFESEPSAIWRMSVELHHCSLDLKDKMLGRLKSIWRYLITIATMLWPARFTIVVVVALGLLLIFIDQAQDARYAIFAEGPHSPSWVNSPLLFWLLTLLVACQAWYWTRFLYDFLLTAPDQPRYEMDGVNLFPTAPPPLRDPRQERLVRSSAWLRDWLPRFLGAAVFAETAFAVARSGDWTDDPVTLRWALVLVTGAILFLAATWFRSRIRFFSISRQMPVAPDWPKWVALAAIVGWTTAAIFSLATMTWLPWDHIQMRALLGLGLFAATFFVSALFVFTVVPTNRRAWCSVLLLLSFGGLTISNWFPGLAIHIGPGAVLLWAAATWIGVVNFLLIFPSEALALPVAGTLLAISLIAALPSHWPGWFNWSAWPDFGNHAVRLEEAAEPVGGEAPDSDPRLSLKKAYLQWWEQAPCYDKPDCEAKPLVLVASEGGASRAAYWSALTLGALEDIQPGFHKSIFAMSGVSGGSLGIAVYQTLLRWGAPSCTGPNGEKEMGFARCSQLFTQSDFLAPVFARMLHTDFIEDLLPGALYGDRAEALEAAWEQAWDKVMGRSGLGFSDDFIVRHADDKGGEWLPIALLNGASEKNGRRIITSDIATAPCRGPEIGASL
jgi:hypothetical protein